MRLFRIARARFAALDGEGARLVGGRWNSPGAPLVYTGTSRSITVLETLAHADPDLLPSDLALFEIDVPNAGPNAVSSERVTLASLPHDWRVAGSADCIARGDAWLRGGATLLLYVPSAIVPEEWNVLINSRHSAMARVKVVARDPFQFDPRLL